jgi:hypothetical protein
MSKNPTERQLCFYCGKPLRRNQWTTVEEVALGRHAHWQCFAQVAYPNGDNPLAHVGAERLSARTRGDEAYE